MSRTYLILSILSLGLFLAGCGHDQHRYHDDRSRRYDSSYSSEAAERAARQNAIERAQLERDLRQRSQESHRQYRNERSNYWR